MGWVKLSIKLFKDFSFLKHKFLKPDIVLDDNVQNAIFKFQDPGFVIENISDNPPPEERYFYFTRKSFIRKVLNKVFYY